MLKSCNVCLHITISLVPCSEHITLSTRSSFLTLDVHIENGTKKKNMKLAGLFLGKRTKKPNLCSLFFVPSPHSPPPHAVLHLPSFHRTLSFSYRLAHLFSFHLYFQISYPHHPLEHLSSLSRPQAPSMWPSHTTERGAPACTPAWAARPLVPVRCAAQGSLLPVPLALPALHLQGSGRVHLCAPPGPESCVLGQLSGLGWASLRVPCAWLRRRAVAV